MKKGLFIWLFVLQALPFFAQKLDSTNLYLKEITACQKLAESGKTDKALQCYLRLNHQYPKQVKVLTRLAKLSYDKKDRQAALLFANEAIDLNPKEAYSPLLALTKKMDREDDYNLAVKILNRLSVSQLDSFTLQKIEQDKLNLVLSTNRTALAIPGVSLQNLGDSINTKESEFLPTTTLDGEQLVFTRNVNGNEDFFIARKDSNGKFLKAVNMGYPPNTGFPDGAAMISADGHYLFYQRCDRRSPNGFESGGCDIAFSYLQDSVWSAPQYFGYTINTIWYEGMPCLSSDNKDLYFVSERPGGLGGKDIWVSHYEDDLWSVPENLGPAINTPKDETSPFIHPDNETFYFSSDGHPGLGKSDLFVTRKNKNGTWKSPINLGSPINTPGYDASIFVSARGDYGYVSSDRADTRGGLDIYRFNTYSLIQPKGTVCMKGSVVDKFTGKKLKMVDLDFENMKRTELLGTTKSNAGDGSYAQALQLGKKYLLHVEEGGYRPYYRKLTLVDTVHENFMFDVRLKRPGLMDTLFQGHLYLDSTTHQLDSTSKAVLDSLLEYYDKEQEDSANLTFLINAYYYSGDSIADSNFLFYLEEGASKINYIEGLLTKRKLKCHEIMTDLDMIIYDDDKRVFDTLDVMLIETY